MKKIALIFAGGVGKRMNCDTPKQFLPVCGKDIIIHTIELFENNNSIDEIYIGCIENKIEYLQNLIIKFGITKVKKIIPGGETGQDTIYKLLAEVKNKNDNAVVLIHDGVRPLVSENTINKCIESVLENGSAITATPCFETPIVVDDEHNILSMPDRNSVCTAQAPQCFYLNDIYDVHVKTRESNPDYEGIVDSCGLMYNAGFKCHFVLGDRGNIKVTTVEDYYTLIGNLNARDYNRIQNND